MNLEKIKFSCPIQMRWNDMDALGHVNNATFVTYFEVARGLFMPTVCKGWDWQKDMFLLANVNVNFVKELRLDAQNVKVLMRTGKIGNKSFELEYAITSIKNDKTILHATGNTTQIMFDMKTRTTIEIPSWVRESLANFDA
ncbi:MAG: thioesterase family protein [Chitinophagales bacterium]|nr:acyl-CoA thioesterase [Bacteroidota bacterium]